MNELHIKRIYLAAEEDDGYRILIDRLWPRGIKKEDAQLDEWNKAIAPTPALRKWFGHQEERFAEFKRQYRDALNRNPEAPTFAQHVHDLLKHSNVTLLYGAKSATCNHAVILREWVTEQTHRH